jgi:hypothetical protein
MVEPQHLPSLLLDCEERVDFPKTVTFFVADT